MVVVFKISSRELQEVAGGGPHLWSAEALHGKEAVGGRARLAMRPDRWTRVSMTDNNPTTLQRDDDGTVYSTGTYTKQSIGQSFTLVLIADMAVHINTKAWAVLSPRGLAWNGSVV
jgi:hypothetical protein